LSIREIEFALVGISRSVGKDKLELEVVETPALFRLAQKRFRVAQVILLAEREINLDRIECRNSRERIARRTHQIADLRLRQTGNAVDWRNDPREAEIQFGSLDRRLSIRELPGRSRNSGFRSVDLCLRVRDLRARRLNAGSLRIDLRLRSVICLKRVVEILLRDRLLLGKWTILLHVEICFDVICLCCFELGLCLR
jgi:hypothetical protein